jgi:hypothetical protein
MTLQTDIKSWNASYAMRGSFEGTVVLTNEDGTYTTSDLRWTPFVVSLQSAVGGSIGIEDTSCFAGTVDWINGIVQSVDDSEQLSERSVTLKVRSYFAQLAKKPIETYYIVTNTTDAINATLQIFGAIPASFIDLTEMTTNNYFFSVISGNNLLDELTKVCQVAESDVFVQVGGKMTVIPWKDNRSSVEITIPDVAVISAELTRNDDPLPSRIVGRGRFVSYYRCGWQTAGGDGNPLEAQPFDPSKDPLTRGSQTKCLQNGAYTSSVTVPVPNAQGNSESARNSVVTETSGNGEVSALSPDGTQAEVTGPSGSALTDGSLTLTISQEIRQKPPNEYQAANAKQGPLSPIVASGNEILKKIYDRLTDHHDFTQGQGGGGNSDATAQTPDPIQMTMFVDDSALKAQFGVIYDQYENEYISDFETLFDVIVRRFQESKMARNSWKVECVYLPCLKLGQVVQFNTPKDGRTITGLLAAISLPYEAAPSARMTLTVLSFEELGSTTYVSGNLFRYPEMCGYNGEDWFVTGVVGMNGGYATIRSGATLNQTLLLEVGADYTLSYESTGGTITATVTDTGGTVMTGAGTFTARNIANTFTFAASGVTFFGRPYVYKTVVR